MIVAIIPDRFKKNQNLESSLTPNGTQHATKHDVRRPTRGIQLKNDSYAVLKVIKGNGEEVPLVNAGSRQGRMVNGQLVSDSYANFLIQSVTEDRMEKQQIVETFGEAFIFFFGERPRVLNIQGVLLNTFDFNWEAEWWFNYDNYLRGTKCVEHDARIYLTVDQTLVSGYIISTSSGKNAQERNHVGFNFQLFVTDYTQLSKVGDPSADQAKTPMYSTYRGKTDAQIANGPPLLRYTKPNWQQIGVRTPSLVESLMATGINSVRLAMNTARSLANSAMLPAAYLDRFMGNPVRVPIGFAGAVALDETKVDLTKYFLANASVPGLDAPIAYSTFGANQDEFVCSDQYATSRIKLQETLMGNAFIIGSSIGAYETMSKAEQQWRAYGLTPPNDAISKMLSRVTTNPLGMMVVGSARNWLATKGAQVASTANTALDKIAPYAVGAQAVMGTVAVGDNLIGAVSPDASQAVDRALSLQKTTTTASQKYAAGVESLASAQAAAVSTYKDFSNNTIGSYIGGG